MPFLLWERGLKFIYIFMAFQSFLQNPGGTWVEISAVSLASAGRPVNGFSGLQDRNCKTRRFFEKTIRAASPAYRKGRVAEFHSATRPFTW
jgi:hypothetical protein